MNSGVNRDVGGAPVECVFKCAQRHVSDRAGEKTRVILTVPREINKSETE